MNLHFVPECYFDTILVKTILDTKKVNHQKCCTKVASTVAKIDDFAVGIIDRDKENPNYLNNECEREIEVENLTLWKHRTKQHFFIQLNPAVEGWILNAATESNINIEELGFPKDLKGLRKITKHQAVSENEDLKNLCRQIVKGNGKTISILSNWLRYLYEHNRNADINTLR